MANQGIKKEGNLEKKSRYLGVWRKRWTVLTPKSTTTSSISTYKKTKQYKSPTECIRIDNQTEIVAYPASEDKGELLFYIQNVRDKERFLFKAESKHDRDEWIKCITNANKKHDKKDLRDIINGTQNNTEPSTDYDIKTEPSTDNTPQNNAQKIDKNDDKPKPKPIQNDDQKDKEPVVEPVSEVIQEQVDNKVDNNNDNKQGQQQEQQKEEIINKEVLKDELEEYDEIEEKEEVQGGIESVKTTEAIPQINNNKNDDNKPIEQHKEQIQNKETDIVKKVENEIDEKKDEQPKEEPPKPESPKEDVKVDDYQPPKQEPPKEEPPKQESPKEEQPKPQTPKEDVKVDDSQPPKEEVPKSEPPKEEVKKEEPPKEEAPHVEQPPKEEPPKEEPPKEEAPPIEEPPKEEPPIEEAAKQEQPKEEQPAIEEAAKEEEPKEEIINNDNEEVVEEEIIKDEEKKENEPEETETEIKPDENNNAQVQNQQQNEEQKQKEVINQNNETETESKPQQDVQQEQSEQQTEEKNDNNNNNNNNNNKPSGLTAAIAEVKAKQETEFEQDDSHRNESEDTFPTDSKTTPVFNPTADDKLDKIDKQISDPEESMSQASSYRSDDGDAPFGNRWGFGLNDTMEDESDDEKNNNNNQIDTTNMEYISIVVIGNKKSGKTLLINTLLENKNDEQKYEQTNDNVISNKVFVGNSDEKDEDVSGILCSFVDTSGDIQNLQTTVRGISISDIAIVMISIEQDIDNVREYIRILNTYGIDKYICCLGYMDNINYNKDKYENVQGKVEKMFKKIGIKAKKIAFIPVNCKGGDNICTASDNDQLGWYKGWTLKKKTGETVLDAIRTITMDAKKHKKESSPFIMPISDHKHGIIYGKIEQGTINKGDKVKLTSSDNMISINEIKRCGQIMNKCIQGDYINININNDNDDDVNINNGDVLYMDNDDNKLNIKPCKSITALVVVSGINKLEIGFKGLICIRSSMVMGEMVGINWGGDKKNTDVKSLGDKEQGEVVFKFEHGIIGTTYDVCESLGRFVVINENKVVLVGKIESVEC